MWENLKDGWVCCIPWEVAPPAAQAQKEAAAAASGGGPASRSAAALIHASNAYLTLGQADEVPPRGFVGRLAKD